MKKILISVIVASAGFILFSLTLVATEKPAPVAANPIILCGVSDPVNPPTLETGNIKRGYSLGQCLSYVNAIAAQKQAAGDPHYNVSPQIGCQDDSGNVTWGPVGNASNIPSPCVAPQPPPVPSISDWPSNSPDPDDGSPIP